MAKLGRPTKLTDELIKRAYSYIYVAEQGEPSGVCAGYTADGSVLPTVEGLASYLKINRDTVYDWAKNNEDFSDIVSEVKNQQAILLINNSLSNKYNATIAKLILSGKHGYVEKQEIDQNVSGQLDTGTQDPELAKQFAEWLKKQND